ncbi:MAG: hypothetical protein PSV35_06605 [bacterium]|nr:hypothetical protein [bacterium]
MKKKPNKCYILLLLTLMFATPGIAAYLFYKHPNWLGAKINKGTLLTPALQIQAIKNQSKWKLILWSPDVCEKECIKKLDMLARVRLALGRKLYQVDQWLILGESDTALTPPVKALLKQDDFHYAHFSLRETKLLQQLPESPRIFIADPDNYLILSYTPEVIPEDVYKDLKLLLNTTETKSG